MLLEVARPVRCEPARTTAGAQLQRAFQMPQFDPEPGECRERVDDQPTAVTGDVIALVGIRLCLDRAVDADRVGDPLVLPPGMGFASLGTGRRVAERTADEGLLYQECLSTACSLDPRLNTGVCAHLLSISPLLQRIAVS